MSHVHCTITEDILKKYITNVQSRFEKTGFFKKGRDMVNYGQKSILWCRSGSVTVFRIRIQKVAEYGSKLDPNQISTLLSRVSNFGSVQFCLKQKSTQKRGFVKFSFVLRNKKELKRKQKRSKISKISDISQKMSYQKLTRKNHFFPYLL